MILKPNQRENILPLPVVLISTVSKDGMRNAAEGSMDFQRAKPLSAMLGKHGLSFTYPAFSGRYADYWEMFQSSPARQSSLMEITFVLLQMGAPHFNEVPEPYFFMTIRVSQTAAAHPDASIGACKHRGMQGAAAVLAEIDKL